MSTDVDPFIAMQAALIQQDFQRQYTDEMAREALSGIEFFRMCDARLPGLIADQAPRRDIGPGEELLLEDGGPIYIVEKGKLEVTVGGGPYMPFGPGQILNCLGICGISHEALPFKPTPVSAALEREREKVKIPASSSPYEVFARGQAAIYPFGDRRQPNLKLQLKSGQVCPEDNICFYNLCPQAALRANPMQHSSSLSDWIPMGVRGAVLSVPKEKTASQGDASEEETEDHVETMGYEVDPEQDEDDSDLSSRNKTPNSGSRRSLHAHVEGGARLVVVSAELIDKVGAFLGDQSEHAQTIRKSYCLSKQRLKDICDVWRLLISRCRNVFPGAPPETVWALAETAKRVEFQPGEVVTREGDCEEDLLLIEEGYCHVEKLVADGNRASSVAIGRLGPSAIIGDICFIGSGLPRPCTVRARSVVEILRIPAAGILSVLRRYPGMLDGIEGRLKEAGSFLQMRLPMRNEALHCLEVFEECEYAFRNELAANCKRQLFVCGQVVADGSTKNSDNVYLLEFGKCSILDSFGKPAGEVSASACFAVNDTLAGRAKVPGSTVRVLTPIAMVIVVTAKVLKEALERHYERKQHPLDAGRMLNPVYKLDHIVSSAAIFSKCSREFIQDLGRGAEAKCYIPGQTLCVKAGQDVSQTFLLRNGTIILEKDGRREQDERNVIGEMVMLGATHHRPATVRAQTVCFTAEIPRAVFLEAVQRHPDERKHLEAYALQSIANFEKEGAGVTWPMLGQAPPRLGYLMNLFAGRKVYEPGDPEIKKLMAISAVLCVEGQANIVDRETNETLEVLSAGDCYNEQILLGLQATGKELKLNNLCELQFVSLAIWDKVISDFPKDQEKVFTCIRENMGGKAARKLGLSLGSADIVRLSPFLRTLSDPAVEELRHCFESHVIRPETKIVVKGDRGLAVMYILLSGSVYVDEGLHTKGKRRVEYGAGKVFGEAEMFGVHKVYHSTVYASTLCVFQSLTINDLWRVLSNHQQDIDLLEPLIQEATRQESERLDERIQSSKAFANANGGFVAAILEHAEDAFFGPGEVVIQCGDPCLYGQSDMFVLLAGECVVETDLGVEQARLKPGEAFGEAGALGLEPLRRATVRASSSGCIHCGRLRGASLEEAFKTFMEEREPLEEVLQTRLERNYDFMISRNLWLQEQVVPSLASTSLFSRYARSFLDDVASPLISNSFTAGQVITKAAEPAESMLVLLEGSAQIESRQGAPLTVLSPGASLGEVAALGLYLTRPSTVRAISNCRVLVITARALQRALSLPARTEEEKEAFKELVADRKKQVSFGWPLSALTVGIAQDDRCARAVALQAERFSLKPDELWMPLSDQATGGRVFSVIVKGRALLEMPSENQDLRKLGGIDGSPAVAVTQLFEGSLVLEGLAAAYGTRVRAITAVEVYRVRYIDFDVAVDATPSAQEWMPRFRMLEADVKKQLNHRGPGAQGVVSGLKPHSSDPDIHQWRARRNKAIGKARTKVRPGGGLHSSNGNPCVLSPWVPLEDITTNSSRREMSARLQDSSTFTSSIASLRRDFSAPDLKHARSKFGASTESGQSGGSPSSASVRLPRLTPSM